MCTLTAIVTCDTLRATGFGGEHVKLDQIAELIVLAIPLV